MADINDLKDRTVSHGTLNPDHLIPVFLGILKDYAPEKFDKFIKGYPELDGWEDFLEADWRIVSDDTKMNASDELFGLLNDIAPEGTMFSSTEGDGADFGFWSVEEKKDESKDITTLTDLKKFILSKNTDSVVFGVNSTGDLYFVDSVNGKEVPASADSLAVAEDDSDEHGKRIGNQGTGYFVVWKNGKRPTFMTALQIYDELLKIARSWSVEEKKDETNSPEEEAVKKVLMDASADAEFRREAGKDFSAEDFEKSIDANIEKLRDVFLEVLYFDDGSFKCDVNDHEETSDLCSFVASKVGYILGLPDGVRTAIDGYLLWDVVQENIVSEESKKSEDFDMNKAFFQAKKAITDWAKTQGHKTLEWAYTDGRKSPTSYPSGIWDFEWDTGNGMATAELKVSPYETRTNSWNDSMDFALRVGTEDKPTFYTSVEDVLSAVDTLISKTELKTESKKSEKGNKDIFTLDLTRIDAEGDEEGLDDMQAAQSFYDEDEAIQAAKDLADSYKDDDDVVQVTVMAGEQEKPNGDIVGDSFDIFTASSSDSATTAKYREKAGYTKTDGLDYYAKDGKSEGNDDDEGDKALKKLQATMAQYKNKTTGQISADIRFDVATALDMEADKTEDLMFKFGLDNIYVLRAKGLSPKAIAKKILKACESKKSEASKRIGYIQYKDGESSFNAESVIVDYLVDNFDLDIQANRPNKKQPEYIILYGGSTKNAKKVIDWAKSNTEGVVDGGIMSSRKGEAKKSEAALRPWRTDFEKGLQKRIDDAKGTKYDTQDFIADGWEFVTGDVYDDGSDAGKDVAVAFFKREQDGQDYRMWLAFDPDTKEITGGKWWIESNESKDERRDSADYLQEVWDALVPVWNKDKFNMAKGYDDEYECEAITITVKDNDGVRAKIYVDDHEGKHPVGFNVIYRYPGDKGVGDLGYYEFQSTDFDEVAPEIFAYFNELKGKVGEAKGNNWVAYYFCEDPQGIEWAVLPHAINGIGNARCVNARGGDDSISIKYVLDKCTPIKDVKGSDIYGKVKDYEDRDIVALSRDEAECVSNAANRLEMLKSVVAGKDESCKSEAKKYYGYGKDDAIDKEDNDFMWQVAYDWFEDKLPEKLAQYADKAVTDVIDKDSRAYEEIVTMDDYYDYLETYGPVVIKQIKSDPVESKKTESSGVSLESIYGDGDVSTHENSADGFYVDAHDPMGFAVLNNDTATMKELFSGKAAAPEKPWTYAGWHEDTDAPENKDGSYPYVYDWEREYDLNFVNDWKRVVGDKNNEKALELLLKYAPDFIPSAMDFWNAFHAGYSKELLRKLFNNIFAVVDKDDPYNNYLGYGDYTYDEVAEFLGDKDEAADSRRVDDYANMRFFDPEEFVKYVRKAYGKNGGYVSIDSVVPVSVLDKANRMAQNNGYKKMESKNESLTLKQKELKDMARYGEAEDITTISDAEAKELKKKGIETVGVSRGTYGMNGALLRDREGNKYVITARSSNLFYFV